MYVQLGEHSTRLNTIGAKVTVVVNVKYLGIEVTLPELQAALPHMTRMLPMVYPATVFCSPDSQVAGFVGSGGLLYWIYCPKERNAAHADMYWKTLQDELSKNRELPFHVLKQRGENLTADQPLVVLSRPSYIGGQEFDAVIVVGLEQGVAPPLLRESPALSATLEQQVLREMYVSFTRARFRLIVALAPGASPNSFLRAAHDAGLIEWDRSGQRQLTLG